MRPRPQFSYLAMLLAIAALAGGLRAWYTMYVSPPVEGMNDPSTYYYLGKHLAAGLGYIRPGDFLFEGRAVPTAEFPPAFPFLLACLHALGITSTDGQKLAVALLGVANVPLIAEITRRLAGPFAALVAAMLAAFSPSLVECDGAFMAEVLYVPLVAASLLMAFAAQGRWLRWALVGGLIGLAGLTRAEGLLLAPLFVLALSLLEERLRWRRRGALVGALVVGVVCIVAPWTLRNYRMLGAFVPVSTNGPSVFLGANCPETYAGPLVGSWVFECYRYVDNEGRGELAAAARNLDEGIAFMWAHTAQLPRVILARLGRTFGFYRPGLWGGPGTAEGRVPTWSRLATLAGLMVLALALPGAFWLGGRLPAGLALLGAPVVLAFVSTAAVYGGPRFRLTAEPSLLVLAAITLTDGRKRPEIGATSSIESLGSRPS